MDLDDTVLGDGDLDDDEPDLDHEDSLYLRYCFEGIDSLRALAAALRSMADQLDGRTIDGWLLSEPVDSGWVHMTRP